MSKKVTLSLTVFLLVVAGLLPVLSMLLKSIVVNGSFSLEAYKGVLTSSHQWKLMDNSLKLASLVTILTVAVGVPAGLVLEKTDLPMRRLLTPFFVVPLLIPPYILAVSWADLLGRDGLLAHSFGYSPALTNLLFGLPGCVFVLFSIFLPIPILLTTAFLRTIDPELEEAGRLVTGWWGVIRGITLPLIMPGILLSAMLVFLLSFGEFSVPTFLRYQVYPVESFTQFSAFYNFKAATASALPLALVTLLLLFGETFFLKKHTYQLRPSPHHQGSLRIELKRHKPWVFALITGLVAVLVVVPIVVLVLQSGGLQWYQEAMRRAGFSLVRSVIYAAIGATLLTVLGFLTGYIVQRRALSCWRYVDSLTLFLFALPSTVVGIGLVSLWNTPWTNLIYGTPLIIIMGYLAKYTALTSRISVTQLAQVPFSLEEAAQIAGARWPRRMLFIVTPLSRKGLAICWVVGYLFALRDTGITMLVYPPGLETLPVRIYTLMANGSPQLVAALCVIMISVTVLPMALWLIPQRKGFR